MRLVSKINLALVGVVAVSAVLNFATLRMAVMPSFSALEEQAAARNQARVMEAIQLQKDQVASSTGDYAFWDDTHDFAVGGSPGYEEKNVTPESIKTLGVNYFVVLDLQGRAILNKGFNYGDEEPRAIQLLPGEALPANDPLLAQPKEISVKSGLMQTAEGLVVVAYAPILRSDRSGERAGTLILGRILNIDGLKASTKVNFDLAEGPVDAVPPPADPAGATLDKSDALTGLDGKQIASVVSHTRRDVTAVGQRTILTAQAFLIGAAVLLLLGLGFVLRQIVIRRIERLRAHLMSVASTGNLAVMPEDGKGDELSETLQSFNEMARQLAELRDKLRKQDYEHGAADQAAGLLHNVRNAVSPVSALAWDLSKADEAPWKQNLAKAVDQLKEPDLAPDRAAKLNQFVAMSAARLMEDGAKRQDDIRSLVTMLRHIDDILKESDRSAQRERAIEAIDLGRSVEDAVRLVERRPGIRVDRSALGNSDICGHKVPLDQVLANLMVNAAEAIEAGQDGFGVIRIASHVEQLEGGTAVVLTIADDGVGIEPDHLTRIFEKGFSTKREGKHGLGLHWCANAINAMGGRIVAESAGAGKGAAFTVTLPAQIRKREAA